MGALARHLLVTNDYPPKTGGIQVYLHELWRRLEPGRATILTASSDPGAADFDATSEVPVERTGRRLLFFPTPATRRRVEAAIERHDPRLVLLDPAWPLGLIGPFLSRPYGVVVHGAELAFPGRLPIVGSTVRFVLARARVVVCAGAYPEAEARRLARGRLGEVLQVPPGVDTDRFVPLSGPERESVRRRLGLPVTAELVVSFSRLVPRKGMDTLIEAAARLAPRRPDLLVVIGGAGRDRERLEALAKRLGAPVRFLGRVADDDLPGLLGAADLFVMDCRSRFLGLQQEGFGIVFVEAGSAGVAAVAGRSGGSHEAVLDGETGRVVEDPRDPDELARAVGDLLADPERRARLGERARQVAVERFDWRVLARRLADGLSPHDGP